MASDAMNDPNVNDTKSDIELLENVGENEDLLPVVDDSEDEVNEDDNENDEVDSESEEEEEGNEEESETTLPHDRPSVKDINQKFPDFFKKFPEMKHMMMRERAYTEAFPTVEDAKEASIVVDSFNSMRNDIFNGEGKDFISALKNDNGLSKFAQNFLPQLAAADKDIHWKVITPLFENMLRSAANHGKRAGNDNLEKSAAWVMDYLFGAGGVGENVDPDAWDAIQGKKTFSEQKETKNKELSDAEKELNQVKVERFNDFSGSVNEGLESQLNTKILESLEGQRLSAYEKKALSKDILDEIVKVVSSDTVHMKYMKGLWDKAIGNGYKQNDKTSIISASLARASKLIPSIRRQLLTEAMKVSPVNGKRNQEKLNETNSRREVSGGRPARSSSNGRINPKSVDWSKTTDQDFMNGNIRYK